MLIRSIEKFLRQHEMAATKFGRLAAHDPHVSPPSLLLLQAALGAPPAMGWAPPAAVSPQVPTHAVSRLHPVLTASAKMEKERMACKRRIVRPPNDPVCLIAGGAKPREAPARVTCTGPF